MNLRASLGSRACFTMEFRAEITRDAAAECVWYGLNATGNQLLRRGYTNEVSNPAANTCHGSDAPIGKTVVLDMVNAGSLTPDNGGA